MTCANENTEASRRGFGELDKFRGSSISCGVLCAVNLNKASGLKCGKRNSHFFTVTLLAHAVLVNHNYQDSLPTQYIFRAVPYICLQSTVHQAGFCSCFLLPLGTHWLISFFQSPVRHAAGGDTCLCSSS